MDDLISRQQAIDALHAHLMYRMGTESNKKRLDEWINSLPSAQPDNRIVKIADLVDGTIDHFDLDDAMDLLYQIKDVLK